MIARDLGVNPGTLGNWVDKDRAARAEGGGPLGVADEAELKRLRTENAELRMERNVLKRSVVLWVNEQVRPGSRLLETERKLLTHAIRMSAYCTESALARLLRPHYARGDDEGPALLREAFPSPPRGPPDHRGHPAHPA